MSINGQGNFDRVRRIERVDPSQNFDDQKEGRRKKKVNYQGRMWEEGDEELPFQPQSHEPERKKEPTYMDSYIFEKANELLQCFTTLEDKIAGIFFYETEAYYEPAEQKNLEEFIQKYKIGGLLFTKGEYKRQYYLIQRYQKLAHFPLLIGNDFSHGISYYFQEDSAEKWGIDMMNAKFFADLGKAVFSQNRNLGVHFQFAEERGKSNLLSFSPSEECIKAFRKGIRDARGIISFFGQEHKKFSSIFLNKNQETSLVSSGEINEIFSLRTLTFFDFSSKTLDECKELLPLIFSKNSHESFLFHISQRELIAFVSACIKEGKIHERDIDRRLLKIIALNIKSGESYQKL